MICLICSSEITTRGATKYCSMACYSASDRRRGSAKASVQRIMAFVSPEPNSGCWLWTGAATKHGYPLIRADGRNRHAHRMMASLIYGAIPAELVVRHLCNNTFCVNPDHLRVGTHADNVADKVGARRHLFGSRVPSSRLSETEVAEIRNARRGGASRHALAARFGICETHVSNICSNKAWRLSA